MLTAAQSLASKLLTNEMVAFMTEQIDEAVAAEREACAKIADKAGFCLDPQFEHEFKTTRIGSAIRARGKQ